MKKAEISRNAKIEERIFSMKFDRHERKKDGDQTRSLVQSYECRFMKYMWRPIPGLIWRDPEEIPRLMYCSESRLFLELLVQIN